MSELGEIANQFTTDAQVILGKYYQERNLEDLVRWCAWHIDSEATCGNEQFKDFCEMLARHKASDYIDLIHYIADIVQCPHPRYKNKVQAHFDQRHKAHEERVQMYVRQSMDERK